MPATVIVAGAAAAAAVPLLVWPHPAPSTRRRRRPARTLVVGAAVALSALVPLMWGVGPLAVAALAGVAGIITVERARSRRRAAHQQTAEQVEECLVILAAELRAGRSPPEALSAAAGAAPGVMEPAARVCTLGGDPVDQLRQLATREGAAALAALAAGWQVAQATGAPLADVLGRVRSVVSDDLATAHEVAEQLAPVRATARVLAILPVTGVLLGAGLGVNVVSQLLTTSWGQVCLAVAVTLVASGLWIVHRISERARSLR